MTWKHGKFYGTTTLGKKGQVVIPAEARRALRLKKGERFLVLGKGGFLALAKLSQVRELAERLENKLNSVRGALRRLR